MRTASKTRLCIPPSCSRELFWAPPALRLASHDASPAFAAVPRDSLFDESTVADLQPAASGFGVLDIEPR